MPRSIWNGSISFGLVNIPVELFPAEEKAAFKFSMLDKRDMSPVGYKRVSKSSGKEVEWTDIVKGYEYEKDQYVVLSDEDFRRANVKATQTIDIRAFVDEDAIPPEYFESPYFLAPDKRGAKIYALLRETLKKSKRIAVAQVVIRTTQHLAAVVPGDRALMLITLRYQSELRPASALDLPLASLKSAGVTAKEIALAQRLVDDMTEKWNPSEFKDTYRDDLMARIKQKIKQGQTKEITAPDDADQPKAKSAQIIDLADLLKRSLQNGGASPRSAPRPVPVAKPGKPKLRVVAGNKVSGKPAGKAVARSAVRRKRA